MSLRPEEVEYWDSRFCLADNIWKRQAILKRLLEIDHIGKHVLEIGTGHGALALAMAVIMRGNWFYTGTDVSPKHIEFAKKFSGSLELDIIHTDIRDLPADDHSIDIIWAFDVLEHVRPDDREIAYKEIDRVLKKNNACICLNIPIERSWHQPEFEWTFGHKEFAEMCEMTHLKSYRYETYFVIVNHPENDGPMRIRYAWAIGSRII